MSRSTGSAAQMQEGASEAPPPRRLHLLPLVLLILALLDLRTELLLLSDHLTVTSMVSAMAAHPLAIAVLLAQPSLWRRYGRPRL